MRTVLSGYQILPSCATGHLVEQLNGRLINWARYLLARECTKATRRRVGLCTMAYTLNLQCRIHNRNMDVGVSPF